MLRKLIGANLAYAVGSATNSAALLLLMPLLINVLSVDQFGLWALFEISVFVSTTIILAGQDVGLMREYWRYDDEADRAQLVGTVLVTVILWGGVLTAFTTLLSIGGLMTFLGAPEVVSWVLVVAWTESILAVVLTVFRIREDATRFVLLNVTRMLVFLVMAGGLVYSGYGVNGAFLGRLVAAAVACWFAVRIAGPLIAVRGKLAGIGRIARYGLPLLPTNIALYLLAASDRFLLQHFATLETVAIYSFAYKVATVLDVLVTRPFAVDWAPRRFRIATLPDAHRQFAQALGIYGFVAVGASLLVLALVPAVYSVLAPPAYYAGIGVVPVILIAYILYGLSYVINVGIMLKDRTDYLPIIGWLSGGVCVALSIWWIPSYGMMGAAWATVAGYAVWTAAIGWASLRLYHVPYSIRQICCIVTIAAAGYAGITVVDQLPDSGVALAVMLKLAWISSLLAISGYLARQTGLIARAFGRNHEMDPKVTLQ